MLTATVSDVRPATARTQCNAPRATHPGVVLRDFVREHHGRALDDAADVLLLEGPCVAAGRRRPRRPRRATPPVPVPPRLYAHRCLVRAHELRLAVLRDGGRAEAAERGEGEARAARRQIVVQRGDGVLQEARHERHEQRGVLHGRVGEPRGVLAHERARRVLQLCLRGAVRYAVEHLHAASASSASAPRTLPRWNEPTGAHTPSIAGRARAAAPRPARRRCSGTPPQCCATLRGR